MSKKLIIKKDNELLTLLDEKDIQNQIDESISSHDSDTIPLLVTYDDDTSETLLLKGLRIYNGGSSSSGGSADSTGNDDDE